MRLFLAASQWSDQPIVLAQDESRYAAKVLRVGAGDCVNLFDGEGRIGVGTVRTVASGPVEVELLESTTIPRPVPLVHLAQALPKGKKMDLIVEKCTELGVSRIVPLQTRHAVTRAEGQRGDRKVLRWRELAKSATRQSGQAWIPAVDEVQELDRFLGAGEPSRKLVCSLASDAIPLRDVLAGFADPGADPIACLVGPEGDFSEKELEACLAAGAIPVNLGASVLRTETAAIFAIGAIRYQFG